MLSNNPGTTEAQADHKQEDAKTTMTLTKSMPPCKTEVCSWPHEQGGCIF